MKIDKLSIDGKKTSIEVKDNIFSSKINETLISEVIYKTNANYKGRKSKTKQKNEIIGYKSKNSEVMVKKSVKNINKMTISEKQAAAEQAKKTPDKKKK